MKRMSNSRGKWFLLFFSSLFFALIIRVAWINFAPTPHTGAALRKMASQTWLRTEIVNAQRGNIYDRNGKPIAISAKVESISVVPKWLATLESLDEDTTLPYSNLEELASELASILDMSWENVWKVITSNDENNQQPWLARKISPEQVQQVRDLRVYGINFKQEPMRYYPLNNFGSTFLGSVNMDNNGASNLEYWYDEMLYGTPGKQIVIRGSEGSAIPLYDSIIENPIPGTHLVLTIDEQLQTILEKELALAVQTNLADSGGGIIMDPYTGEILAMAALPNFDPNDFMNLPSEVVRNPLISEAFEPGSTFKIITCLAALTEGVTWENDYFSDPGYYQIGDNRIWNWDKGADHGVVSLMTAMRDSSNVVLGQLGLRLGADRLVNFQKLMGFGAITGVDFPAESSGILFDPSNMKDIELFTSSFGQGPSVTPLQQLNAINAIVNGGHLLQPRLVKSTISPDQQETLTEVKEIRSVSTEDTMRRMRDILLYVLNAPGSKGASDLYTLAGKTGTANKFNKQTGGYYDDIYIASTIGFAPAENPRYSIYIYLDNPHGPNGYYGGQTVAPAFRRIAEEILSYAGYLPDELKQAEITGNPLSVVPDLRGKTKEETESILGKDRKVQYFGTGSLVAAQYPGAGEEFSKGQTLHIYLTDAPLPDISQTIMPNLLGKSLAECVSVSQQLDLVLTTSGSGSCIEQSVEAGRAITKGSSIRAKFN